MYQMRYGLIGVACILLAFSGCKKSPAAVPGPESFLLTPGLVNEASGIADSKANAGMIWVEQDGGNPAELTLLTHQGQLVTRIPVQGGTNTDWEDMALAPGPDAGRSYLYLADIGDNSQNRDHISIYRGVEARATDGSLPMTEFVIRYEDGPRDAEAFLVDPQTLDLYLITKRDAKSRIYKVGYPYIAGAVNTATRAGELPYSTVVSAAMQADGKGVVVKDYFNIYFYSRKAGESIPQVLAKSFTTLPYQPEQQGEAVCFSQDGKYYFTLSERVNSDVFLVRYPK